ncbi:hypothetical protein KY285_011387 [Solanum tuberosum]|nr:hypothetical protein KY285_011387 [Solanum tuberosum]
MAKNVSLDSMDQKLALAKRCSHEGAKAGAKAAVFATVATAIPTYACGKISPWARAHLNPTAKALIVSTEGVVAGAKAAVVASVGTAIPIYAFGKMSPWAKTYLNPTAKALIISTAAGMAYFVVADKTILKIARQNSFKQN